MTRLVVTVRDGRHPHEVLFLVAAVIAGIGGTLHPPAQSIAHALMPAGMARVWYALLIVGAVIALAGIASSGRHLGGLLVERVGMLLVGGLCCAYGGVTLVFSESAALVGGAVLLAFGLASLVRARQIRRDLQRLRVTLRDSS